MARAGTLPDYLYQKDIQVGEKINLSSTTSPATTESQPEEEEEVTEYDSSSDKEACESDGFVEEDSAGCSLGNQQITRDVDFLECFCSSPGIRNDAKFSLTLDRRYSFKHLGVKRHYESYVSSPRTQHNNPVQVRRHTARFEVQYRAFHEPKAGETVAFGPQVAFKAVVLKPDVHKMKKPEALLQSLPFS
ncbi:hypothetical protein ACROYT_G008915 [Oculina patagonica]